MPVKHPAAKKTITTMYESGYYPAGAEHDPYAPYNQVDLNEIYEEEAHDFIKDEIESKDDNFIDWLYDREYIPEEYSDEDIDNAINDEDICDEYHEYRLDDVIQDLAERAADDLAYQESEAYEAYREDCLLGIYD